MSFAGKGLFKHIAATAALDCHLQGRFLSVGETRSGYDAHEQRRLVGRPDAYRDFPLPVQRGIHSLEIQRK